MQNYNVESKQLLDRFRQTIVRVRVYHKELPRIVLGYRLSQPIVSLSDGTYHYKGIEFYPQGKDIAESELENFIEQLTRHLTADAMQEAVNAAKTLRSLPEDKV